MNKIFKVIWSKSKQCYVVVSEIAKNKTGKKKIVVAGIFAALAMVGTMQHAQAVDGPGRREGWPSGVAENGYAKYKEDARRKEDSFCVFFYCIKSRKEEHE